jgi:hypothetical protein
MNYQELKALIETQREAIEIEKKANGYGPEWLRLVAIKDATFNQLHELVKAKAAATRAAKKAAK